MYIPNLPTYLVFYLETSRGSSIAMPLPQPSPTTTMTMTTTTTAAATTMTMTMTMTTHFKSLYIPESTAAPFFVCSPSLPQEIKMVGQPLEVCHTAQKARRAVAKAVLNAAPALQLAASLPRAICFPNPNDMAAASTADTLMGVIPLLPTLTRQLQWRR
jgi:hypothetical protein